MSLYAHRTASSCSSRVAVRAAEPARAPRRFASVILVAVFALGLAGCDKIAEKLGRKLGEKAVEGASGGEVSVDTSNGGATVTDKKTGTVVQSGTNTTLPAGWPAAVPLYPGAQVRNAVTAPNAKNATLVTKDPPAKVAEFYKKSGLKLEAEMNLGTQLMLNFKNGKGQITMMISQAGGETMASISIVD